jgi:hypothetical protein
MGEIERDVRTRLRQHLIKRGGAADYQDEEIFEAVRSVLARAVDERNVDATLLPELLDTDVEWRLQTHLALTTHRPADRAVHPVREAADPAADDALAVRVQPGEFPPPGSSQPAVDRVHRGTGDRERPPSPCSDDASAEALNVISHENTKTRNEAPARSSCAFFVPSCFRGHPRLLR